MQKLKSFVILMISMALVVVSHSMDKGMIDLYEVSWTSLSLLGSLLAVALTFVSKSPQDAHAHDKKK